MISNDGLKLGYDWAFGLANAQNHNAWAEQLSADRELARGVVQGAISEQAVTDEVISRHARRIINLSSDALGLNQQVSATQAAIDSLAGKKVTISFDSSGAGMFERFTDRARRVVVLAQEQARELNHNYIGTEHLLLGLLHEGEGVAAQALTAAVPDFNVRSAWQQVEKIVGRGEQKPSGHIPFTPRGKKVLEYALREALQLGHNYIGTEHILLALIREGEGVGAKVLVEAGAELNAVRVEILRILGAPSSSPQPSATSPEKAAGPSPDATLLQSLRIYVDAINAHLKAAGY